MKQLRDDDFNDDDFERSDLPRKSLNLAQISNKINKIKHTVKLEGYRQLVQILA